MRSLESESREGGCNSSVMSSNPCFGDANNIRGDCSVSGSAVESTRSDDSNDVWYGSDCGRDSLCRWVLNFLESIFDLGDNEKSGRGSMDSVDPGIGQAFGDKARSRGSGEGTLTKGDLSLRFFFLGGIPVGVGGGDKEAGDVASPRISSEKRTRLLDRRLEQNATRRMASTKVNGFGCLVALVRLRTLSKRLAISGHSLLRPRA